MKKALFLYCIISLSMLSLEGIGQTINRRIMPLNKDAIMSVKDNDYPINLTTGKPNINIPLMSVSAGSLGMGISLEYQPKTLPYQNTTWLDGKWHLATGGMIARVVNGLPDEYNSGSTYKGWHTSNVDENSCEDKKKVMQGYLDTEPDVYYFRFGSRAGKFIIKKNGNDYETYIFPHQNIKIIPTFSSTLLTFTDFKIIDEQGTTYSFGTTEALLGYTYPDITFITPILGDPKLHYYLHNITSVDNDQINIQYASVLKQDTLRYNNYTSTYNNQTFITSNTQYSFNQTKRVLQISYSGGYITFDTHPNASASTTETISQYDSKNQLIKKYIFNVGSSNQTWTITEKNANNDTRPYYQVTYDNQGRVSELKSALGGKVIYEYNTNGTVYKIKTTEGSQGASTAEKEYSYGTPKTVYPAYQNTHTQYLVTSHPTLGYVNTPYTVTTTFGTTELGIMPGEDTMYDYVVETVPNISQNKYYFSFVADEGSNQHPFAPYTSNAWKRGLPTKTESYVWRNGSFQEISETTYQYEYRKVKNDLRCIKVGSHLINMFSYPSGLNMCNWQEEAPIGGGISDINSPFIVQEYFYTSGIALLTSTTSTSYQLDNASKTMSSTTNYTYASHNKHFLPLTVSGVDAKGQIVKTSVKYLDDYTLPTNPTVEAGKALNKFKELRILHTPIEKYTEKVIGGTSYLLSSELYEYKTHEIEVTPAQGGNPAVMKTIVVPAKSYGVFLEQPLALSSFTTASIASDGSLTKDTHYENLAYYEKYDSKGRLVEYKEEDGITVSNLYDDIQKRYRTAQAYNARESDIAFTSFDGSKGRWLFDEGDIGTSLGTADVTIPSKFLQLSTNKEVSKANLDLNKKYQVCFVSPESGTVTLNMEELDGNGQVVNINTQTITATASAPPNLPWSVYKATVYGGHRLKISGNVKISLLRLMPLDATIQTTAYHSWGGTHMALDTNFERMFYEYDKWYRLRSIRDSYNKIIKAYTYHQKP
ncbi:MAG: hypothetical protein MUC49_22000 [Raineya sp.]|jgi:hypothetical protein|nr:hypothetical protein [Raineya sp.]